MSWIIAGTAAAGALSGAINNNQKRGQAAREKDAASIQTRFSPWSGLGAGTLPQQPGSQFGDALSGGIGGALVGQKFSGLGAAKPNPMAGAEQVGVDSSLSPAAQTPGNGMMAGGYSQSPWAKMNPNFYNS